MGKTIKWGKHEVGKNMKWGKICSGAGHSESLPFYKVLRNPFLHHVSGKNYGVEKTIQWETTCGEKQ